MMLSVLTYTVLKHW